MKRIIIGASCAIAALALATTAQASTPYRSCPSTSRITNQTLGAHKVNCSVAQAVERYTADHEWVLPFRVAGRRWVGRITSTPWQRQFTTTFVFQSGSASVRIFLPFPAS
jgi:hypothetical protein